MPLSPAPTPPVHVHAAGLRSHPYLKTRVALKGNERLRANSPRIGSVTSRAGVGGTPTLVFSETFVYTNSYRYTIV